MGWLDWKGPYRSQSHGMVGLERSLKIKRELNGWVGRVLKDSRAMGWLGWDGMGGSLQIIRELNGWVGRVLKDNTAMGWLGWKGPYRSQSYRMI